MEANYHGLPVPGPAATVMRDLSEFRSRSPLEIDQFPADHLLEAFALAQHYGLPTRLLDWTWHPLTAVYFAAEGACRCMDTYEQQGGRGSIPDRIGIWCLWTGLWFEPDDGLGTGLGDKTGSSGTDRIIFIDPPRAPNKNLLAQNGLFTLHAHRLDMGNPPAAIPLDTVVRRHTKPVYLPAGVIESMYHLTLPTIQTRRLLNMLAEEDVTAAKLFPGYGGVVKHIQDGQTLRQTWRAGPNNSSR